jgi:hypothetical protein
VPGFDVAVTLVDQPHIWFPSFLHTIYRHWVISVMSQELGGIIYNIATHISYISLSLSFRIDQLELEVPSTL